MAHTTECQFTRERRALTADIRRACEGASLRQEIYTEGPYIDDGSFEQMANWYGVLTGIVAEYSPGGDQELENCDCGEVQRRQSA